MIHRRRRIALPYDLPPPAVALVTEVARRSRLWNDERRDLIEELCAHFADGLDAGEPLDSLVGSFGSPEITANLVKDAKRKARPIAWRAAHRTVMVAGLMVVTVVFGYLTSAASLYFRHPSYEHGNTQRVGDVVAAAQSVQAQWSLSTLETDRSITVAQNQAVRAIEAGGSGGTAVAMRIVTEILRSAQSLRGENTVAGDYASVRVEESALDVLSDGLENEWLGEIPASVGVPAVRPIHFAGMRNAFAVLVDQMYSLEYGGDGRLTGDGIEMVRQIKKWHKPTLTDRLMEPVWYALPASRAETVACFENLMTLAETGIDVLGRKRTAEEAIVPLTSLSECLRFPAVSCVLKQLSEVMVVVEKNHERRGRIFPGAAQNRDLALSSPPGLLTTY